MHIYVHQKPYEILKTPLLVIPQTGHAQQKDDGSISVVISQNGIPYSSNSQLAVILYP